MFPDVFYVTVTRISKLHATRNNPAQLVFIVTALSCSPKSF